MGLKAFDAQKAVTIAVDGTITEVAPANGTDFKLEELHRLAECEMVEVIYLRLPGYPRGSHVMVLDEEGKVSRHPKLFNDLATVLARSVVHPNDYIAGPVLVCLAEMVK
jgi:hypothetical protein